MASDVSIERCQARPRERRRRVLATCQDGIGAQTVAVKLTGAVGL